MRAQEAVRALPSTHGVPPRQLQGALRLLGEGAEGETVLSHTLERCAGCLPGCPGHQHALDSLGRRGDAWDTMRSSRALCRLDASGTLRRVGAEEYQRFLRRAEAGGLGRRGNLLEDAARALRDHGGSGADAETYYRLVLDGTRPEEAARISAALR